MDKFFDLYKDAQEEIPPNVIAEILRDYADRLDQMNKLIAFVYGLFLFFCPLAVQAEDVEPIPKSSFSCASDGNFNSKCDELFDVDGYVLAGIETHICVYQTERQMSLLGKHVEVVADAVSSRNKTNHNIALDRIRNSGGFLTTTEMILFELKGNAEGDVFRELSKLVK